MAYTKIHIDEYSSPPFDEGLLSSVEVTDLNSTAAIITHPEPWDRIQIDLIDEYGTSIQTRSDHIGDLPGIVFKDGFLQVDTFYVLTQLFNKTTGSYTIRVSGFRNYIYTFETNIADESDEGTIVIGGAEGQAAVINDKFTDEATKAAEAPKVDPADVLIRGLEVVEISRSRKEIRVKSRPEIEIFNYTDTKFNTYQWQVLDV